MVGRLSIQGREERLQVWEGMKGSHGNLLLPIANVAIQSLQASFQWTLKPLSQEVKPRTWIQRLDAVELEERRRERPDRLVFLSAGTQAAFEMPLALLPTRTSLLQAKRLPGLPTPTGRCPTPFGIKGSGRWATSKIIRMTRSYFPGPPTFLGPRVGEAKYQGLFPIYQHY